MFTYTHTHIYVYIYIYIYTYLHVYMYVSVCVRALFGTVVSALFAERYIYNTYIYTCV